ncbi:hypothetical protein JCM10908_001831 [Rhodotorula pacifica]|uniref:lipase family protein n=1 Tax=Rhodotorula pacifica TaxID=1495444 RepID=UPI0031741408
MQQSSSSGSNVARGIPQFQLRLVDGVLRGDPADAQARTSHRQDLERISTDLASWRVDLQNLARTNVVFALIIFLLRTVRNFFWTLVLSPATIFIDPLGTLASLIIFPVVNVGVALCCVVFWLGGKIGLNKIIDWASDKWAQGYSMPNWPSQDLFGPQTIVALQASRPILQGDVPTTEPQTVASQDDNPDFTRLATGRIFSVPLARVFLAMSALVYERKDSIVDEAADIAYAAQKKFPKGSAQYDLEMTRAENKLSESEERIKQEAAKWGLAFDGVSDLSSVSGPFASIFYTPPSSNQRPFIVLCFKGTTPVEYAEWLVDASIAKTGAAVWYGPGSGAAHEGFYTDLFGRPGADGSNGYVSIVRTLKHVAQRMKAQMRAPADGKIPLWVCGHSLGAALASLCYARFLHSEKDLGDDLHLRDCYTYGTPRVGNGDFASAFEESLVSPIDRGVILWRVINHLDVVCRVPPGLGDDENLRGNLASLSVLNYAHLGPSITIRPARFPFTSPYYALGRLGAFHEATQVKVTGGRSSQVQPQQALREFVNDRGNKLLRWALSILPAPLYNHFPASYDEHLYNIESSTTMRSRLGPTPAREMIRIASTFVHEQADDLRGRIEGQVQNATQQVQQVAGAVQNAGREAGKLGRESQQDISKEMKKKT